MAAALQKLKDQGWYLSEDGVKKLVREDEPQQTTDVKELVKRALDVDLRDISKGGGLSSDYMKSSKLDVATSGVVVQVLGVRNVTAPKANEESKTSPRLLQLDLTDGQNVCVALEMEHIQSLSINTAPGTKILLKGNIKMSHGMLMLGPSNVTLIGGLVPNLFENWEQNRVLAKYAKGITPKAGPNGPPSWIPFGQKSIQQPTLSKDRKFKSMTTEISEESKENAEFTALRNEAIALANKSKTKKVFGGEKRKIIDHNVKKIIDKGFTEDQAQLALKYARNNLERAMGKLKLDRAVQSGQAVTAAPESSSSPGRFGRGGRRGREEEPEGAKPSGKVSLFDFLTDKIPMVETMPITSYNSSSVPATTNNLTSKSFNQNNFSSNSYPKRTDDYSSQPNYLKRSDDHRRSDNYNRRIDDLPKGYSSKYEDDHFRKNHLNGASKPSSSSHFDDSTKDKSRAIQSENVHLGRSAKSAANGTLSTDRVKSVNSISASPVISSTNPFSLENRAKFQNNMSSSFANRNKRDDNNDRSAINKRDKLSNENGKSVKESLKLSCETVRSHNNQPRKGTPEKIDLFPNTKSQSNVTKSIKGATSCIDPPVTTKDNKRTENPFSKTIDRRGKTETKPRSTPSPAMSQDTKLVQLNTVRPIPSKSTPSASASTSLQSKNEINNKNHSTLTRSKTQPPKSLDTVFPTGFEFNPNKIMGFTNKETNEVAQNMLKAVGSSNSNDMLTQLLDAASIATTKQAAQSSLCPLPEAFVPAAAVQPIQSSMPTQNPGYAVRPVVPSPKKQPMPAQQFQPHIQHQPQFITPVVNPSMNQPHQQSAIGLQNFNWALKLHDLCFAKYWEDGRYYHAEITGMSENTCVVEFMEYGNFEEVLITDCVPITEENIQMINQYNTGLTVQPVGQFPPQNIQPQPVIPMTMHMPVMQMTHYQTQATPLVHQQPLLQTPQQHQTSQHPYQQPQQQQFNNNAQYNQQHQHMQRMRGERQMYVPPAQRSTK